MEALAAGLRHRTLSSTVVLGAGLIAECGTEAQKQELLPKIADGSLYLAFAHSERKARFRSGRGGNHGEEDGGRLAPRWPQIAVLDGAAAGQLIISARRGRATARWAS